VKYIPLLLFLAGCASSAQKLCPVPAVPKAAPRNIMPRVDLTRPGFQILSVREHRVDLENDFDHQIFKHYAIDVAENGFIWRIVVNRENQTVMQLLVSRP
jgi:hypothetical protein